jgi:hypothetical protein
MRLYSTPLLKSPSDAKVRGTLARKLYIPLMNKGKNKSGNTMTHREELTGDQTLKKYR